MSGLGYTKIKVRGALGLMSGRDLSVNASLTPEGNKLLMDPKGNVKPTDPGHEKLFVTFTSSSGVAQVESKHAASS